MSLREARLLIVNTSDLGRTAGLNDGIFEAHRNGLVTSGTLMVAYPAAGDGAARVDNELRSTSGYAAEREYELAVLTSPEARQAVEELDLRLVHFGTAWPG